MRVRVLFFAIYREMADAAEMIVELDEGATLGMLVERLRRRGGGLQHLPAEPLAALNREYAPLETSLKEGDEVAFLPPVAGG